jgi:hypothetical protein
MKKKGIILIAIFGIIIVFLLLKHNTNIYIGNYSVQYPKIDVQIIFNQRDTLNDSIAFSQVHHTMFQQKLKVGFNEIVVLSKSANIKSTKTIFLLPNQYIGIELGSSNPLFNSYNNPNDTFFNNNQVYFDKTIINENVIDTMNFWIDSYFNPFIFE